MAEIITISQHSWRIEDEGVRFFLLEGEEKALMIDSGMNTTDALSIVRPLTDKPIELLNTHADRDHICGNGNFEWFYMNEAEEENLRSSISSGRFVPVRDGDIIDLGNRPLQVIEIPGHTPGSIAVLDVNERILISGDTVSASSIFMFGRFRNLATYICSLQKLQTYRDRFDVIYPSHGDFPLDPDIIEDLIRGAVMIAEGKATGERVFRFGKLVMLYQFKRVSFLAL